MSWLNRLWHALTGSSPAKTIRRVRLTMSEWTEQKPSGQLRVWRNSHGDVLSVAAQPEVAILARPSSERGLQHLSRDIAQNRGAGLIETSVINCPMGTAARLIYKRLQMPRYIYTGMLFIPVQETCLVWTHVAGECGTTGVREAIVTAELMAAGKLTLEDYERSFAQDPYDPTYHGVDRSVLRFISDDESYDSQFPDHPLTRVRGVLWDLPHSFQFDPQEFHETGA